jgi:hypothetical protein
MPIRAQVQHHSELQCEPAGSVDGKVLGASGGLNQRRHQTRLASTFPEIGNNRPRRDWTRIRLGKILCQRGRSWEKCDRMMSVEVKRQ